MKVILNRDVASLGKTGEIRDVADGFARNWLLPRHMAVVYSEGARRDFESKAAVIKKKHEAKVKQAEEFKTAVEKLELIFSVNVDAKGELYGSVSKSQIIKALDAKGISLPKNSRLEYDQPIKKLGESKVVLRLHPEVAAEIRVVLAGNTPPTKDSEQQAAAADTQADKK